MGYSYSIVRDLHTAHDITQEPFVDSYHLLPKLRRPETFSGWLRTIVFKYCDRHLRRRRETAVEGDTFRILTAGESSPLHDLERKDRIKLVREAIGRLNQQERTAIVLYCFNDYSYREIAEFLEVTDSTVNHRMYRGRKNYGLSFKNTVMYVCAPLGTGRFWHWAALVERSKAAGGMAPLDCLPQHPNSPRHTSPYS